jgi:hypothetical protein
MYCFPARETRKAAGEQDSFILVWVNVKQSAIQE